MKVLPAPVASESRARMGRLSSQRATSRGRRGWRRPGSSGELPRRCGKALQEGLAASSVGRSPWPARSGACRSWAKGSRRVPRRGRQPGETVVLDELVAVGGKDKGHVEALRRRAWPVRDRGRAACSSLCLDQRQGDGLRRRRETLTRKREVDAAGLASTRLAIDDLDGAGGFLAPDQVLGPAPRVEAGSMSLARVSASLSPAFVSATDLPLNVVVDILSAC